MWAPARSMWRKEESSPVSLSPVMAAIFAQRSRVPGRERGCSGRDPELELWIAGIRAFGVAAALVEAGDAHAEQPHRPGRVVGAQQVEGDGADEGRIVGRRLDRVRAGDVGPVVEADLDPDRAAGELAPS